MEARPEEEQAPVDVEIRLFGGVELGEPVVDFAPACARFQGARDGEDLPQGVAAAGTTLGEGEPKGAEALAVIVGNARFREAVCAAIGNNIGRFSRAGRLAAEPDPRFKDEDGERLIGGLRGDLKELLAKGERTG
jgi:hypothetical protein